MIHWPRLISILIWGGWIGFATVADGAIHLKGMEELEGFKLVPNTGSRGDFLVLQSEKDLVMVDGEGDICPLPIPKDGLPRSFYQSGYWLIGNWRNRENNRLRTLDLRRPIAWSNTPKMDRTMYLSYAFADSEGRPLGTDYRGESFLHIDPAKEAWTSFFVPVLETSRQLRPIVFNVGEVTWIANRRFRERMGNMDFGGLIRMRDGLPELLRIYDAKEEQVVGLVPLGEGRMLIQFWNGSRRLVDDRNAAPVEPGAFDASLLGNQLPVESAVAPDGTVWMLTMSRMGSKDEAIELNEGRYHQLWRWDGKRLEPMALGMDRRRWLGFDYSGTVHVPVLRAVSRDEAWVGTIASGILRMKDGEEHWLDWRCAFPFASISALMLTTEGDVVVQGPASEGLKTFAVTDAAANAVRGSVSPDLLTRGKLIRDTEGALRCLSFRDDGLFLMRWSGAGWGDAVEMPVAFSNLWTSGFDSLNRFWVYERSEGGTGAVHVVSIDTEPIKYANQKIAYQTEVARHGTDFQPGMSSGKVYWKPLVCADGQIWFMDSQSALHVFDGELWVSYGGRDQQKKAIAIGKKVPTFSGPPFFEEGKPMILRGQEIMTLKNGKWATTGLPITVRNKLFARSHTTFRPNRNDSRYNDYGGIYVACQDIYGAEWIVTRRNEVVCLRNNKGTVYPLEGNSMFGDNVLDLVPTGGGRFFIGGGDRYSLFYWSLFDPKLPHLAFDAVASGEDNKIEVGTFNHNRDPAGLQIQTRLAGGAWEPISRYEGVREGAYTVEVRCVLKAPKPFTSDVRSVEVEVVGDLLLACQRSIADLGAPVYKTRRAARENLRAAGEYAIPLLRTAAGDEDPEIRSTARELILEIEAELP